MTFSGTTASCPAATRGGSAAGAGAARTRPTQRARVTMFFDGTLNNRANTSARLAGTIPRGAHEAGAADSYANDLSNVARLEPKLVMNGAPYDRHFKFYVEGIGTFDGRSDSDYGAATGMGDYGVPAKVRRGLNWAVRALRTMPTSKDFEYIHTDAFGFSRGAAAARYYVNQALNAAVEYVGEEATPIYTKISDQLRDAGYVVCSVGARFGGLFDTVASYGVVHRNDTSDLALTAISACRQVFHIAAGDEHRANFRLTNINSCAGRSSMELFLPGVHSDIGGGYTDNAQENLVLWEDTYSNANPWSEPEARRTREREWMIARGWYSNGQMTDEQVVNRSGLLDPGTTTYRLRGVRTVASNKYALIPLRMMADFAREQELVFSGIDSFASDAFLGGVYAELSRYAADKRSQRRAGTAHPSAPGHWLHVTNPMLRRLRAGYFHMSAHCNGVLGGIIWPNKPEYSDETRRRIVQNG